MMHTKENCGGCHYYTPGDLDDPCYGCVRAFSGRQADHFKPKKRIDNIGQNGNDGLHYKVEGIARILAGEGHDKPLNGKMKGKQRWELHVQQAIAVLNYIEEHNT